MTWPRRLVTLPTLLAATLLCSALTPLLLPLAWVSARLWRPARSATRVLLFLLAYLWCETLGIVASAWLWLRYRNDPATFTAANYRLQLRWASALEAAAAHLFRLQFEIEGDDCLGGDGVIMMPRHCSIGDTVLPIVFYCARHQRRLRYVLKRELLLDPCLDVVGNRLPNAFIDRQSASSAGEVASIQALTKKLGAQEGVLIYPEGTRFSTNKRKQLIARLQARGDHDTAALAQQLQHVLPPRMSGPCGLLRANPGRDLVFCAHTGFEGSASFRDLFNGSWLDTRVRLRFWRVAYADIPRNDTELRRFLRAQWQRMDREVARLRNADPGLLAPAAGD